LKNVGQILALTTRVLTYMRVVIWSTTFPGLPITMFTFIEIL